MVCVARVFHLCVLCFARRRLVGMSEAHVKIDATTQTSHPKVSITSATIAKRGRERPPGNPQEVAAQLKVLKRRDLFKFRYLSQKSVSFECNLISRFLCRASDYTMGFQ